MWEYTINSWHPPQKILSRLKPFLKVTQLPGVHHVGPTRPGLFLSLHGWSSYVTLGHLKAHTDCKFRVVLKRYSWCILSLTVHVWKCTRFLRLKKVPLYLSCTLKCLNVGYWSHADERSYHCILYTVSYSDTVSHRSQMWHVRASALWH